MPLLVALSTAGFGIVHIQLLQILAQAISVEMQIIPALCGAGSVTGV
jgi:hypothetical protein